MVEAPAVKPTRPLSGPPLPYLINVMDKLPAEPHKEYAFNVGGQMRARCCVRACDSGGI